MPSIYTVAQVNSYIKNMFAQDYLLHAVSVKGEVSNCKYHSSGHIYFTLKDKLSVIACVMFSGNRTGLSFPLKEGMQIVVTGTVDLYERDGKYQLYAKKIIQDGIGALYERFEQLKFNLAERGLFAPEYKQPLPKYIRTLGVVTAKTGAAVRDIITITKRRNPYVQIIVYPAVVQGDKAVGSIINGIHALEALSVDVMIVGRGGGSIEDLWAFNEEAVAQAIFDCSVPVISAVGHETDTTIADFVADVRAATPSAAAELAVSEINELMELLEERKKRLSREMLSQLSQKRMLLQNRKQTLDYYHPKSRIRDMRMQLVSMEDKLQDIMQRRIKDERKNIVMYIERLKGLSPLDKLKQGFSFVEDEKGKTVYDIEQIQIKDKLYIHVRNGKIGVRVEEKEKEEWQKENSVNRK